MKVDPKVKDFQCVLPHPLQVWGWAYMQYVHQSLTCQLLSPSGEWVVLSPPFLYWRVTLVITKKKCTMCNERRDNNNNLWGYQGRLHEEVIWAESWSTSRDSSNWYWSTGNKTVYTKTQRWRKHGAFRQHIVSLVQQSTRHINRWDLRGELGKSIRAVSEESVSQREWGAMKGY